MHLGIHMMCMLTPFYQNGPPGPAVSEPGWFFDRLLSPADQPKGCSFGDTLTQTVRHIQILILAFSVKSTLYLKDEREAHQNR